jgi:hypothetical protein
MAVFGAAGTGGAAKEADGNGGMAVDPGAANSGLIRETLIRMTPLNLYKYLCCWNPGILGGCLFNV